MFSEQTLGASLSRYHLGGALLSVIVSAYHLATRVRIPSTKSMLNIVQIINLSLNWNAKRMKINKKRPRFPHFFQKSIATLPAPVREIFVVEVYVKTVFSLSKVFRVIHDASKSLMDLAR